MDARIAHVAVNADDVGQTQKFYESVLGWQFADYAPGFVRAELPDGRVCAIQQRRQLGDHAVFGMEVTFAVDDVAAVATAAEAAGGRVLLGPTTLPGVGELLFVQDTSGNVFGAMRYERD
jgi:hypothetical protein